MEKKKLKKLVLKKDVVSRLENVEMSQMKGGTVLSLLGWESCFTANCNRPTQCVDGNSGGIACESYACDSDVCTNYSCQPVESCAPMQCPGDGYGGGVPTISCYCGGWGGGY